MNLSIDVGNTSVKVAVFEEDTLVNFVVFEKKIIISEIKKIVKNFKISQGIMSSVASVSESDMQKLQEMIPLEFVSSKTKVPFNNKYKTPLTLGVDRIVLMVAAVKKYPKKNVLVIDAGSCITFDFVTKELNYLGGAISPGVAMRYKALHNYTANLPLLDKVMVTNFVGGSTVESMHAGVVNGVVKEIDGVIAEYKDKYLDLTVVLTGGDTNFLSKQLKSSIFANQNFLLYGLNELLTYKKTND